MPTLHVVIPFYNEPDTVERCVRRVIDAHLADGWQKRIVIVDDRSAESSHAVVESLVRQLQTEGCDATLRRHDVNRGKGAALATGFDAVLEANQLDDDLVIIQDADLEYDPADYAKLMEPIIRGEAQAVVGTRWGAHNPMRGLRRRIHRWGNRLLTVCSNVMTGYQVRDMECCYKVLPINVLRRVRPSLNEPRFGIEPQMMAGLARLGVTVTDVAISYDPRSIAAGKKIGWRDGLQAFAVIVRERFRSPTMPDVGPDGTGSPRG